MLFSGDSCIEHEPGSGQMSFKQHKQDFSVMKDNNRSSAQCTSIFIEPVSWMLPLLEGIIEGKVCTVRSFIYSLLSSLSTGIFQTLNQLPVGLIAQYMVQHCTGVAEVMVWNPVQTC